jgi:hypothetical protein
MAHTRRTARKSTDRLPVSQLAPQNVPQPQESQPDIPQEASPEDHGTEDKTNEEHPPPSNTEPEKMYRDADEVESFRAESLILADRLRALLEHLGITTAPWYRVKEVSHSQRVEFKAITEIFFGSRILCRHKGPTFRTLHSDAVANAAWQDITSWVRRNKSWLQNSVPRMEMVHHQDVAVELSTRLLTAQHEIETLHAQL